LGIGTTTCAYARMESVRPTSLRKRFSDAVGAGIQFVRHPYRSIRDQRRDGAVILMYHSVAGPDLGRWIDPKNRIDTAVFRRQMQFLAKRRRVISLSALVGTLEAGERPKAGTVVITFDDGYVDNLRVAFPLLDELGLPATLFLPTAYIDDARPLWIDELYSMFQMRSKNSLTFACPSGEHRFGLDRKRERWEAYSALSKILLNASYRDRADMLRCVEQQLAPTLETPRLTMTWREVSCIPSRFKRVEFGSHSVSHLDLAQQPDAVVQHELVVSKRAVEQHSGSPVQFFAYPYNRICNRASEHLVWAGYRGAVASGAGALIEDPTALSALPRLAAQ
jgi:peptidoglycan/xylan/chitin deacetylase (PgdA/CDA1 family)